MPGLETESAINGNDNGNLYSVSNISWCILAIDFDYLQESQMQNSLMKIRRRTCKEIVRKMKLC